MKFTRKIDAKDIAVSVLAGALIGGVISVFPAYAITRAITEIRKETDYSEIAEGLDNIQEMDDFEEWEDVEKELIQAFLDKDGKYKENKKTSFNQEVCDLVVASIKSTWDNYHEYQLHEKHILPRSVLMKYYITCVKQTDEFYLVDLDENSDNRRQLNEEHAAGDNATSYSHKEKLHRIRVFRYPDNPNYQHETIIHEFVHSSLNNFLLDTDLSKLKTDQDTKNFIIENKDYIRKMFAEGAAAILSKYAYPYDEHIKEHTYGAFDEFGIGYNNEDLIVKTHSNVYPTYSYCANKLIYFSGLDNFTDFLLGKISFTDYCNIIIDNCGENNFKSIITDIIEILKVENITRDLTDNERNKIKSDVSRLKDIDKDNESLEKRREEVSGLESNIENFKEYKDREIGNLKKQIDEINKNLKGLDDEIDDDEIDVVEMNKAFISNLEKEIDKLERLGLETFCADEYNRMEGKTNEKISSEEFKRYLKKYKKRLQNSLDKNNNEKNETNENINKKYGAFRNVSKYYVDLEKLVLDDMTNKINCCKDEKEIIKLFQEYCQYRKVCMCDFVDCNGSSFTNDILSKYLENIETSLLKRFKQMGISVGEYKFSNNSKNNNLDNIVFECILQAETECLIDNLQISAPINYSDKESKEYAKSMCQGQSILSKYEDELNEINHQEEGSICVLTIKDSNGRITYAKFIKDDNEIQDFCVGYFSSVMMCFKYLNDMEINNKDDFLNFLFLRKETQLESYNPDNDSFYNFMLYVLGEITDKKIQEFQMKKIGPLKYSDIDPQYPDIEIYQGHIMDVIDMYRENRLNKYCNNLSGQFKGKLADLEEKIKTKNMTEDELKALKDEKAYLKKAIDSMLSRSTQQRLIEIYPGTYDPEKNELFIPNK